MDFRQHTPYSFSTPQACYALEIYTDGAYFKQRQLGGWGVAIYNDRQQLIDTLSGVQLSHSSLEMELIAAIRALQWQQDTYPSASLSVYTDAKILLEGLFEKYPIWQKNDWHSAKQTPVVFAQLWQQLYKLAQKAKVDFYWIKGHHNNPKNQLADQLAREKILTIQSN